MLVTVVCLAIAAVLVVRAILGSDALTRDVRHAQVQLVEGAIGKRRFGSSGGPLATSYFLDVGDRSFNVGRDTYQAAPDAGIVRLYFLPRSRKVVNLERLPNAPLPNASTSGDVLQSLADAMRSPSRQRVNEAHAGIAAVGDALESTFAQMSAAATSDVRDPRPLGEVIVGTWSSGLMTVTFSAGGQVTIQMLGTKRAGHWSIDSAGRLRADITGKLETTDARVAGNQLTIAAGGADLTLTRESGA
jgi:hypothetical protein